VWERACIALGMSNNVDTVSGVTHVVPRIEYVVLGPPLRLTVRLTPGMIPEDIAAAGARLARSLGGVTLRVERRRLTHGIVTVLAEDPLGETFSGIPESGPILIGRNEQGQDVTLPYGSIPHSLVVGSTGSGKSSMSYALIAQCAARARAGEPI